MSQEIYVKEMPKSCFDCPIIVEGPEGYDCCVCAFLVETAESKNRLKDCPLKSLHDHDKELIEKVCKRVFNIFDGNNIDYICVDDVIERLQKEFEDE